ncbi:endolytic transglycosylase MltG [Streptomyces sp. TRM 70351]|uniref:endolytic transglycosylase MltG n=1 Tax=Streptomyces sp. TRM 70351 TaxID=3116552 RepID=UPI002E7AF4D1|nr:endolytic transglycosylase MltG [Streptomyces sp. TRM 70351]MEE1929062.1 endolytic transglycosylase MltG [Streptomyces sp. TRM 70351]
MTEYGRGPGSQPWHPEDPLYGDRGWDGNVRQQDGWDGYGHQQPSYPEAQQQPPPQDDPYAVWQTQPGQHGSPEPGGGGPGDPYGAQLPPQPYGGQGAPPGSYDAPGAYPAPPRQQESAPQHDPYRPYEPHQAHEQEPYGQQDAYGQRRAPDPYQQGAYPQDPDPQGPYEQGPHEQGPYEQGPHQQGPYRQHEPHQAHEQDPYGQRHEPEPPQRQDGYGPPDEQDAYRPGAPPPAGTGRVRTPEPAPGPDPETGWDPGPDEGEQAFFAGRDGERADGGEEDGRAGEPATRAGRRAARTQRGGGKKSGKKNGMACMVVALVLLGGAGGATYAGYSFYQSRFGPAPDYAGEGTGEVQVEVPEGASLSQVANILKEAGVVKSHDAFVEVSQAGGTEGQHVQPGIYTLRKEMSAENAFELILDPASQSGLIVPEGRRASEIYAMIDEKTGSPEGTTEKAAEKLDVELPSWAENNPVDPLEGFLFPSKYSVSKDTDPAAVLTEMVERAKAEFDRVGLVAKAREVGHTPYEVLVIASLLEAEAQDKDDFAKVSRVIYNRLEVNPETNGKLDFDSTINYAMGRSTLEVSVADTNLDSPYNTYRNAGLPPGPIDNPGHHAIEAATNPADGDWQFFVTVKPGDTRFTATYEEHQEHVADFNEEMARQKEEDE